MLHYVQAAAAVGASPWYVTLLGTLVPLLSGLLAKLAADGVKQLAPLYDKSSSAVKLVGSFAIAFFVGWLATKFSGVAPLGTDLHGWTADALGGFITALLQSGIYRLNKNKNEAIQGKPTAEQKAALVNPKA